MLFSLFIPLLCVFMLTPCASAQQPTLMTRQTSDYFMTASALFLYEDADAQAEFSETWTLVKQTLGEIESAVSVSVPDSDISRFNELACGEEIVISDITAGLLQIAMDVHALTGGLYDPTVYPLVDLWGFSPRFNTNSYALVMPYDRAYENGRLPLPDTRYIDALLPLVGLQGVALRRENGVFYLKKNTPSVFIEGVEIRAQLDLGGIAKGYACDRVLALLRERGCTMGYFVCGGSSMALLSRPDADGAYALTLRKPRKGAGSASHYATLRARDTTLSTSGDYSHSFVSDGIIYCHIIDPRTGYPINMPDETGIQHGIASATLLCPSAAYGDALTTALCILGPQEAKDFLKRNPSYTVVMAAYTSDEKTFQVFTNASPDEMTLDDPAYQFALEQGDF